jgi:hypothetical protein
MVKFTKAHPKRVELVKNVVAFFRDEWCIGLALIAFLVIGGLVQREQILVKAAGCSASALYDSLCPMYVWAAANPVFFGFLSAVLTVGIIGLALLNKAR